MLQLRVRNLDLVYNQDNVVTDVNVRFETVDSNQDFFLNGSLKIAKAEYDSVANIDALADLMEIKLKEIINKTA